MQEGLFLCSEQQLLDLTKKVDKGIGDKFSLEGVIQSKPAP